MIHPDTELKYIGDPIGYGVFATAFIPEGTIVYVIDPLETVVTPTQYDAYPDLLRDMIDKYSYIDSKGNKVVSWDHAKYVNHCCNCNTMSTGYGFEIAIKDIQKGEEITDEYGLFNIEKAMKLTCGAAHCRKKIKKDDFDNYYQEWDEKVKKSFPKLYQVAQPLLPFIDCGIHRKLEELKDNPQSYKSVYALKYN